MSLIVITGQTATGKTQLALDYAKKNNGELINFDSRQVYKHLDIVTGKDVEEKSKGKGQKFHLRQDYGGQAKLQLKIKNLELNKNSKLKTKNYIYYKIPQKIWLYDVVEPDKYYSSFEYIKDAQNIIQDIRKRGKTPILVGGSYFYLRHLLYGFDYKVPPDFKLREKLNKKSVKELQKILSSLNSQVLSTMNQSDINNPRRLIRKIEIEKMGVETKGVRVSNFLRFWGKGPHLRQKISIPNYLFVGLRYKNKDKLKEVIKIRVEKRLKQGAVEEVEKLLKKGFKKSDPGLKTIGYKQIIEYLDGSISKEKAIDQWITAEIQYAKRQYTFMKKDKNIKWREI